MNKKVVLASSSPRRKELLGLIFNDFAIAPAECDETLPEGINPREAVEHLAKIKNQAARKLLTDDALVISADTVVAVGNEILGKPENKGDARRMISLLSGKTHFVYTGVTLYQAGKEITFSEKTEVEFLELTEKEIEDYISTDEPYDKAGGYGIQGKASLLIKGINGDYFNVVGLPVARLGRAIAENFS